MRSILISGVSSGIGFATAMRFLEMGWRVIGSVRKLDDAEQLKDFGGENFSPIVLDVTDLERTAELAGEVPELLDGKPLDVLCNNAGTSVPAATAYQSVTGFRSAVELNLIAPFAVTRALYPLLAKPGGRILFIGSLAGIQPLPFCAAYSAAKHGIEGLAGSLRAELNGQGIMVSVIAPGSTRTAIATKIGPDTPLDGIDNEFAPAFARMAQHMAREGQYAFGPERVARVIERAATVANPRARYVVTPAYISNWLAPRFLGRAWQEARWRGRLDASDH
ncbi:MAG: SDR family NAD(P)-dependent oxidoreductase [Alphaproteobacteria bacterium]|nr:MAG: SDR family NAD(P)-dependent oxidoreductase [Alphaproteobacteria bacterium]